MATKKRARPTGKPRKDEHVQIRLSADQKRAFGEAAAREDLGISAWLRRLGLREVGNLASKQKGE
jgi:hypothetical protein